MKNIIYSPIHKQYVKTLVPLNWTPAKGEAAKLNDREIDAFLCGGGAEVNACQISEVAA